MHTAPYWAMAHLTCYHCRITCVVCRKIEFLQVVTPRTIALAGVAFNATTPNRVLPNPFPSKSPLRPCRTRAEAEFQSQSYPLSINTRNAREFST